jgi:hypothetical protein
VFYVAIHQHTKQITVCIRNKVGDTVLRRQVSIGLQSLPAVSVFD